MTEKDKHEADERGRDCLQLLHSLSREMKAGLEALASNDLARFESSVAAQERLCETGRGLTQLLGRSTQPTAHFAAAARELRQQGRVYATAVVRAAQVGDALLSLYQDSRGYSPDGRTLPVPPTWSCEV